MGDSESGGTPYTVFDYLGLGFILEPPGVLVHAVMTGEHLDISHLWYAIPFVLFGTLSIYVGRNWGSLKTRVNFRVAKGIDRLSQSYIVPFIIAFAGVIGVAILPIFI